jgi:pimeloyl-ACP methyl ester carboxylesterase
MGAYAALQFARLNPGRAKALVLVGIGSGSPAGEQAGFRAQMQALARLWPHDPERAARAIAENPNRQAFRRAAPAAFGAWLADLEGHSPLGMALTCANYQGRRPSLEAFADGLGRLKAPTLVLVGEEDAPCREASDWLAALIPGARLEVLEGQGHAPNLEDPDGFNRRLAAFLDDFA